ncbi:MAG TPA: rhomboid family intramembrane serine protease [Terriglobales bacterium]|jgi:rhomboid protease GluP|nr:rhomboid family intramembrane serine protease [Terriglobales bacterium]
MPNCANCGRPLFSGDAGETHPLCPQCRQQILGQSVPAEAPRAPSAKFPVTTALLSINVLMFVAMGLSGVSLTDPTVDQLVRWGADYGPLTLTTQPWRLLTSTFVHGGLLHIGTNMWCLWNLGRMAENFFGRLSFLLIYLLTGISGSLLSVYLHPMRTSVGASGAIFGLAGALITALYLGRLPIPKQRLNEALRSLIFFAVINLAIGAAVPVIDNSGHIGGFSLGLLIGALLSPSLTKDPESKAHTQRLVFSAVAVVLAIAVWFVRKAHGI